MKINISGKEYSFVPNAIECEETRESYFSLVQKVFGLDFRPWYRSGYCGDCFVPCALYHNNTAVASVAVALNDFKWRDNPRKYAQLSTVTTDPEYRLQGLSRWLTKTVLNHWQEKCNCVYLYANDSVLDFYPKFGYETFVIFDDFPPGHKRYGYRKYL